MDGVGGDIWGIGRWGVGVGGGMDGADVDYISLVWWL